MTEHNLPDKDDAPWLDTTYDGFMTHEEMLEEAAKREKENQVLEIAKQAIKRKTGARGLRSIMEDILMETMFELPNEDLEKVIIDENTVVSKTEPIKLLKTAPKKSSAN